ncbi:hypothetical protein [Bradyrhizobium sp. USDA 4471]
MKEELARNTKHWNMPFLLARLLEENKETSIPGDKSLELLKADATRQAGKARELSQRDWDEFL